MENQKLYNDIVNSLHKNCRLSLEELAAMHGISVAAAAEIIDNLEKDGTILGYGAIVNWDKINSTDRVTAYIELKITPQRNQGFDRIAERIYQYPEVTALNLMSGSYDFGVTVEGDNLKDISLFVSQHLAPMEAVISTATHFVLKRYKNDGTILTSPKDDDREVMSL
ncbi:MAG: Lrp/AsnC family transcriptional regulator [Clostridia bacterium]|nr:Lrp/AsnC family transcriptional regulator [Clostridia bacterium]